MTVTSTTIKTAPYACDGVTVTFAFSWKVWETSEVKVILRVVADGSETTLTEGTAAGTYSVTLSSSVPSAGSITTVTTYSALYEIVIKANFPETQEIDYGEGDKFPAESHEEALDRGVRLVQQLGEQLSRALLLPESSIYENFVLPEPEANKVLAWNNAATAIVNTAPTSIVSSEYTINAAADYTVTLDNRVIFCTGTITITLAAASSGFKTIVINKGTGVVTIVPVGTDTMEGSTQVILSDQYQSVTYKGDGVSTHVEL